MVVGMACISKDRRKDDFQLHTVYVKPMHRKQGIGKALIDKAIAIAKKSKRSLSLRVNPLNKPALHLYESLGFKICKCQSIIMDFNTKRK